VVVSSGPVRSSAGAPGCETSKVGLGKINGVNLRNLRIAFRRLGQNKSSFMCRNIKTLANFEPPASEEEIRASALQFVRKLSGNNKPSKANEEAFNRALEDVTAAATELIRSLKTTAPPRNREDEARKAKERSQRRFA
jgi:hypothetical protein